MVFDQVVSHATSRRWTLIATPFSPEQKLVLDWTEFLPRNIGTKHQREYLLKSVKEFLHALINFKKLGRGGGVSPLTVSGWFYRLKRMVGWMIGCDIWRFSQLDDVMISVFLDETTHRLNGQGTGRSNGKDDDREVGNQSYAAIVCWLWNLRHDYAGAIRINPAIVVFNKRKSSLPPPGSSGWHAIDESAALPLIRDAVRWIDMYGTFMVQAVDSLFGSLRRTVGLTKGQTRKRVNQAYATLEETKELKDLRLMLGDQKNSTNVVFRKALNQIEGACLIVLLFLIGLRCSELVGLDVDAVALVRGAGGSSMYRVKGVAAKKSGALRTWVASEPVMAVIDYVTKLYAPMRDAAGHKALFLSRAGWVATVPAEKMKRMTHASVATRIKSFAFATHRKCAPPIARLHPHAARKTFARFVVLRDKRALESLSYHFGHTHRMITDGYYIGSDIELAKLVDEEGRKDLAKGLEDILQQEFVAGKAGRSLQSFKKSIGENRFRGRLGLKYLIDKLIDDGVQLAPCDWGYCVYSQSVSACKGTLTAPNEANRSPEVCSNCANFVVTESHRIWWSERYERDKQFIQQPEVSEQSREWVERRIRATEKVLRDLNVLRASNNATSSRKT
ncbi:Phage integrase [Burkholderia sp. YI23]|nr:Phage integrase [Burkholderia sp. YI23]